MPDREKINPASRLYNILEEGRRIKNTPTKSGSRVNGSRVKAPVPIKANDAMARLFNVSRGDFAALYEKQVSLLRLLRRTKAILQAMEDPNAHQYQRCVKPLENAIRKINLADNQSWQLNAAVPSDSDMALLGLAASAIEEIYPERLLELEELEELKSGADTLLNEAKSADVSQLMRAIIIDSLENVKFAIEDYETNGAEGLKSALAESYGRVVVDADVVIPEKDNEWVKRYWEYLGKFTTTVNATEITAKVGTTVVNLLDKIIG